MPAKLATCQRQVWWAAGLVTPGVVSHLRGGGGGGDLHVQQELWEQAGLGAGRHVAKVGCSCWAQ
jgi:hypothetical protein